MDAKIFGFFLALISTIYGTIEDPSELNCDFDFPCHWYNGTSGLEDNLEWKQAQAVMVGSEHFMRQNKQNFCPRLENLNHKLTLSSACDAQDTNAYFVMSKAGKSRDTYAYSKGVDIASSAWLVSATVPRQLGAGVLRFSLWRSSDRVRVMVCGRRPPGYPSKLDCSWHTSSTVVGLPAWQNDRAIIPPSDKPFEIVIVAQFTGPDDIAAIDDIKYEASLGSLDNTLKELANFVLDPEMPRKETVLSSNHLQLSSAEKTVRLPKLPLTATTRRLKSRTTFGSFESTTSSSVERETRKPPSDEEIMMALRNGDFEVIAPDAVLPTRAPRRRTTGIKIASSSSTRVPTTLTTKFDFTACPQVSCDFDSSTCQYATIGDSWRHSIVPVGNRITGVPSGLNDEGGFLYAGKTSKGHSTLQTRPFTLLEESVITLHYHMAGMMGRLRICESALSVPKCLVLAENTAENFSVDLRRWQAAQFTLTPGEHRIGFVADKLEGDYVIGIDMIQLWTKDRLSAARCRS